MSGCRPKKALQTTAKKPAAPERQAVSPTRQGGGSLKRILVPTASAADWRRLELHVERPVVLAAVIEAAAGEQIVQQRQSLVEHLGTRSVGHFLSEPRELLAAGIKPKPRS